MLSALINVVVLLLIIVVSFAIVLVRVVRPRGNIILLFKQSSKKYHRTFRGKWFVYNSFNNDKVVVDPGTRMPFFLFCYDFFDEGTTTVNGFVHFPTNDGYIRFAEEEGEWNEVLSAHVSSLLDEHRRLQLAESLYEEAVDAWAQEFATLFAQSDLAMKHQLELTAFGVMIGMFCLFHWNNSESIDHVIALGREERARHQASGTQLA